MSSGADSTCEEISKCNVNESMNAPQIANETQFRSEAREETEKIAPETRRIDFWRYDASTRAQGAYFFVRNFAALPLVTK